MQNDGFSKCKQLGQIKLLSSSALLRKKTAGNGDCFEFQPVVDRENGFSQRGEPQGQIMLPQNRGPGEFTFQNN